MMERLIIDDLLHWAKTYKVPGWAEPEPDSEWPLDVSGFHPPLFLRSWA